MARCKYSDYCLKYLVPLVLNNSDVDHTEYCRVAVGEYFKFRLVARRLDKLRKTGEVSSRIQFDFLNLLKKLGKLMTYLEHLSNCVNEFEGLLVEGFVALGELLELGQYFGLQGLFFVHHFGVY